MAIIRLSDLITVFESKWTYGDVKFGYESDVNEDHDTKYPLMLIQPPASIIPEIYDGREEYEFEINFYNLYPQAAQSVVTLQKRWDNLQDLAMEWFDMVLKFYQDVTVEAYLNDESLEIERVKEVANDRLVQIKFVFTMSAFTKCFRPVSVYPSDFSNLVIWLKADSGVTFDIPTQRVSAWADQSGNNNNVAQSTSSKQPLRYGFDGANDKAYINFNGSSHEMTSTSNSPLSTNKFTAYFVAKQHTSDVNTQRVFSYSQPNSAAIVFGFQGNRYYFNVNNNSSPLATGTINIGDSISDYAIVRVSFSGTDAILKMSINNAAPTSDDISGWSSSIVFNETTFDICKFAKANLAEMIFYNRILTDAEASEINNYLNTKYKIY